MQQDFIAVEAQSTLQDVIVKYSFSDDSSAGNGLYNWSRVSNLHYKKYGISFLADCQEMHRKYLGAHFRCITLYFLLRQCQINLQ